MPASRAADESHHKRQRDAAKTRDQILRDRRQGIRRPRLCGRPCRPDRRPDPHDQADDLLLLRRQGAAVHRRAGTAYAGIRRAEQQIDVEHLDPVVAIRRLAELTFDHHESNPDFIRLVSIENIHRAEHLGRSEDLPNFNTPAHRADHQDPRSRPHLGRVHARRRRRRPAHDDQCILRLPRRQPAHLRRPLRPRPDRPAHRDHYREMLADMVVGYLTTG